MSEQHYTWNAEKYEQRSSPQEEWARELLGKLRLKGSERLLDIGCGGGKVTVELARGLPRGSVCAIDSSAEMVELAKTTYPADGFPNLEFRHVPVQDMAFDNEFDVVFSNAALHWVPDHARVLRRIHHSLKDGGRMLLQMGGRGNGAEFIQEAEAVSRSPEWKEYFSEFTFPWTFHSDEEYRRFLLDAGFDIRRTELIPKHMFHRDTDTLIEWLQTVFLPYTARVPEHLRDRFLQTVVDRYLEDHPLKEDGATHIKMVRLEIEALK